MKTYTYAGGGAGIPGLPASLSEAEAKALQVDHDAQAKRLRASQLSPEQVDRALHAHPWRQLQAALESGQYVEAGKKAGKEKED